MKEGALKVYIAGPYSGEQADHVHQAALVWFAVIHAGHEAFVPHCWHLVHLIRPMPYEFWMARCLAWLEACDCLLRMPGQSPGADREVERAKQLGMPVFFGLEAFLAEHGPTVVPVEQRLLELLQEEG